MHRNITAMYRTREVAEMVRHGLKEMGVSAQDIHVVPDPTDDTSTDRAVGTSSTTTGMGAGAAPAGTKTAGANASVMPNDAAADRSAAYHDGATANEDTSHSDRLHELHLPEEDLRTYQHAVRRGDYVVSVEIDDDNQDLDKVKQVMRRPEEETYHLENSGAEFSNESVIPHTSGEGRPYDDTKRARHIAEHDDPYARTYERGAPLSGLSGVRRDP